MVLFFFLIYSFNLIGLFPFFYGLSTSLYLVMDIALFIWLVRIFINFIIFKKGFKKFFRRFVPSGAPLPLVPFLVLIELIRNCIRPLTLTVRLVANIRVGHIIITLLSHRIRLTLRILFYFYLFFEIFVSTVQAYIFTLLISLYISDRV